MKYLLPGNTLKRKEDATVKLLGFLYTLLYIKKTLFFKIAELTHLCKTWHFDFTQYNCQKYETLHSHMN